MVAIALAPRVSAARQTQPTPISFYEDPLDRDDALDVEVTTTRRGLTRLALVASETSARFYREGLAHDPMAWMLAPRELFGGESALSACLERDNCLRAILLHGLSLGLDVKPATIDALLVDGPATDRTDEPWPSGDRGGMSGQPGGSRRLRLYSATIVVARGGEILQAFHASVALSAAVVRERIRARFGSAAAAQADIQPGFDPDAPGTLGLVPPAILETLMQSGRRVRWASLAGLDITVEQRLPS